MNSKNTVTVLLIKSWFQREETARYLSLPKSRLTYRYTEHCLTRSRKRVQETPLLTNICTFEDSSDNKKKHIIMINQCRHWTETCFHLRLLQGVFSDRNSINLFLMTFLHTSLHCKLLRIWSRLFYPLVR